MRVNRTLLSLVVLLTIIPGSLGIGATPGAAQNETASPGEWTGAGGNSGRTRSASGPGVPSEPSIRWTLPHPDDAPWRSGHAAAGGRVFIVDDDGGLHAIDEATGKTLWTREDVSNVSAAGDGAYAHVRTDRGESGKKAVSSLVALDGATGEERWRFESAPGQRLGSPAIAQDLLVMTVFPARDDGALPSVLVALDTTTGVERWRWEARGISALPAVAAARVFVSQLHGKRMEGGWSDVVSLDAQTGQELWRARLDGGAAGLVSDGLTVYVGSVAGDDWALPPADIDKNGDIVLDPPTTPEVRSLLAFDAVTGDERWRIAVDDYREWDIALSERTLALRAYIHTPERGRFDLVGFDAASGQRRWVIEDITGAPVLAGGLAYTFIANEAARARSAGADRPTGIGDLVAIDLASGDERWRLAETGLEPIVAGATIYAFSIDGLQAIGSGDVATTEVVSGPATNASSSVTGEFGAGDRFEIAVSTVWCPEGEGSDDQPLRVLVGRSTAAASSGTLTADGAVRLPEECERDIAANRITLAATRGTDRQPREIAGAWTDEVGIATLRGTIPDDAAALWLESAFAPALSFVFDGQAGGPSPLSLALPLARAYTIQVSETKGANLTLRDYTCPEGTADPVANCSDTPVEPELDCAAPVDPQAPAEVAVERPKGPGETPKKRQGFLANPSQVTDRSQDCARTRTWDEFEVQRSSHGGTSPETADYFVPAGLVRIVERPFSRARWAGAFVSCVDDLRGDVVFSGTPDEHGAITVPVSAGVPLFQDGIGAVSCAWYHMTPAAGTTITPPSLPAPARPPRLTEPGLYLLSGDGSSLHHLPLENMALAAPEGMMRNVPAWSPDGTRLALIAADGAAHVVDVGRGAEEAPSAPLEVADLGLDLGTGLSWSPDGRELLAVTTGGDIVRIAADGSKVTPIVDPELPTGDFETVGPLSGGAAWLPDGGGIIYAALERRGAGVELFTLRFDESDPRQLTSFPDELSAVAPVPSPDGQHIAAFSLNGEDGCATVVMARDGSALHGRYWCAPVLWSPDGKWILAIQYVGDGGSMLILDSAAPPRAFVSPFAEHVSLVTWAPDSDRFAFIGAEEQILVASRSGATPVAIAGIGRRVAVQAIAWSPVDDRLAVLVGTWE